MTFEELEEKLLNGFHDASICEIRVDFVGRSVVIFMDLLVGGPDDPDPELCRPGRLCVAPAFLFFMQSPDPRYPFVPTGTSF